ncbi:MAG: pantetheine-phosphate adenylyltransferase, partial [Bacillales bacterium]|nr:pantetheine-phosphate adenylyltransferase [Bacillales bacterium]
FSTEEKINFLKESLKHLDNIVIDFTDKLVYEYCFEKNIGTIIRGVRTITDYQSENQLFYFNYELSNKKVDTVCLFAKTEHSFLSSSMVKELALFKGDVSKYVPPIVVQGFKNKCSMQ